MKEEAYEIKTDPPLAGFPLSSSLYHAWLQNYLPHDFGFVRWKYLNVDEAKKRELKKSFRPLRNFR